LIRMTLRHLADRVATRLRAKERAGKTVTVRVRFAEMHSVTRSVTLPGAISATPILAEVAHSLVNTALTDHPEQEVITLLAISVSQLVCEPALQLELPIELGNDEQRPGTAAGAARWALDRSVDAVRDRFGRKSVGYASVSLSELGAVPDEFRELAEKDG